MTVEPSYLTTTTLLVLMISAVCQVELSIFTAEVVVNEVPLKQRPIRSVNSLKYTEYPPPALHPPVGVDVLAKYKPVRSAPVPPPAKNSNVASKLKLLSSEYSTWPFWFVL